MQWPWNRKRRAADRREFSYQPVDVVVQKAWSDANSGGTTCTRDEALTVPAVRRGRNMLCSIATMPLEQFDERTNTVEVSSLLRQIDLDVPNVVTVAQTVEDLLMDAIGWWRIAATDAAGYPVACRRVAPSAVSLVPPAKRGAPAPLPSRIDPRDGVVWIDGVPVSGREVIRFDSPNPGICQYAGREVRRAILLDKSAGMYADDPRPADYFSPAEGADEVDDDEVMSILGKWKAARKKRATAWVPASMKYNTVDVPAPRDLQLVELQQQAALDIANAIGVDPEDLGLSTTSRTYTNDVDRRRNRLNDVLSPYMRAITDRLSMGDVTRRSKRVRFNTTEYLLPNPTDRWGNYRTAKEIGAMAVPEIREREGMTPMAEAEVSELNGAPKPPPVRALPPPGPAPVLEQPDDDVSASAELVLELSADDVVSFVETSTSGFAVDRERRIIEGLVLPYDRAAMKGGVRFRFTRGSVLWRDEALSRVKLLREHDRMQPIGVAAALRDTAEGLFARFRVARGPAGDDALALAEDGVLDGLSVGVNFNAATDAEIDPADRTTLLVRRADLKEISLTALPSFDDARVTRVAASAGDPSMTMNGDGQMPQNSNGSGTPAPSDDKPAPKPEGGAQAVNLSNDQLTALLSQPGAINALVQAQQPKPEDKPKDDGSLTLSADQVKSLIDSGNLGVLLGLPSTAAAPPAEPGPERVNPNPDQGRKFSVREPEPYVLDRNGNLKAGTHDFSADIHAAFGPEHDMAAYERAIGWVQAQFASIAIADVNELNPDRQRPDMYVDQLDFVTPLFDSINRGTLQDITPFVVPKFNSSSGLVSDHVQGIEPTEGAFTTTGQTITPTAISGKVIVNREVWDQGGNPQLSTLLWNQMLREWREELESATATFLNTLTAATDIAIATAAADDVLASAWNAAMASLQFVRGGHRFSMLGLHIDLYKAFVDAVDGMGRPLYPIINPQNANGTATSRFGTLDLGGVTGVPAWALGATGTVSANSWLFNPMDVHGWASAPERIDISYQVASVEIGIWGYKAFANTRIDGVRQVTYDPSTLA